MKRDLNLIRLSRDHHRGLALALRIERDLPGAGDEELAALSADVLSFWMTGLLPHFRAECECLLARLVRHVAAVDELILRTQGDHLRIDALIAAMRDEAEVAQHRMLLADLGELLRTHIRWEESVLFEVTQTKLDKAELRALGADLSKRLAQIPPPPSWPARRTPP